MDKKVIQSTIPSAELISIPTNNKLYKEIIYIHNNKLWYVLYVIIKIIYLSLRALCLANSNHSGMGNFYSYSIIPSSDLRKQSLILIIGNYSQIYHHQPIYMEHVLWQRRWRIVIIKLLYWIKRQNIFCRIKVLDWKIETYQYWLCCYWLYVMCNSSH